MALGDLDLRPAFERGADLGTADPWEAPVAALPATTLATDTDDAIATALVDARHAPVPLALGTPQYRGSTRDPATDATIVTYSVPVQGPVETLTRPVDAAGASARALKATIDGQHILFAYRIAADLPAGGTTVSARFEEDHQRLTALIARRAKQADDVRAVARAHVLRLLRERRARERGAHTLDQELQARLDEYLRR